MRIKIARKVFIGRRRRKEAFSASSAAQNGFLKGRATKLVANYDIPTLYVARVATPCKSTRFERFLRRTKNCFVIHDDALNAAFFLFLFLLFPQRREIRLDKLFGLRTFCLRGIYSPGCRSSKVTAIIVTVFVTRILFILSVK